MSGRYYYCEVTATSEGGEKKVISKTAQVIVQKANYSITNGEKTKYYNILSKAVEEAVSGGGDTGGGTIEVLNDVSDASGAISVNKTITIDTNGYTLTRDDEMKITEKTLTINGGGTINCIEDKSTFRTYDGNISVSSVTIMGDSYGINTAANTSGIITVNDSYIYSTGRSVIGLNGSGKVEISDSWIYAPNKDKNAIRAEEGCKSTVTITGSNIGCASKNTSGTDGSGSLAAAIVYHSTGSLTLTNSWAMAGPYGSNALTIYEPITVNLNGSTRLYATNTTDTADVIYIYATGTKVIFNSTGCFYGTGSYVAATASADYKATYTVTKGQFATRSKYKFASEGKLNTTYVSSGSAGNRPLYYMNSYNSRTSKSVSGMYYYSKGV